MVARKILSLDIGSSTLSGSIMDIEKLLPTPLSARAKFELDEIRMKYPPELFDYKFTFHEPNHLTLDLTPNRLMLELINKIQPTQPKLGGIQLITTIKHEE